MQEDNEEIAESAGEFLSGIRPDGIPPDGIRPDGIRPDGIRPDESRQEGRPPRERGASAAGIPRDPRSRPREPSYAGEGWLRSGDPAPHGFRMLDAGALIL